MKYYFFLISIYLLVLSLVFFKNPTVTFAYCLVSFVFQCLCKAPSVPCVCMALFSDIEEMNINNTIHTTAMQQMTAMWANISVHQCQYVNYEILGGEKGDKRPKEWFVFGCVYIILSNLNQITVIHIFAHADNKSKSVTSSWKPVICCLWGDPHWSAYPSLYSQLAFLMWQSWRVRGFSTVLWDYCAVLTLFSQTHTQSYLWKYSKNANSFVTASPVVQAQLPTVVRLYT